jgi:hypothetical protein
MIMAAVSIIHKILFIIVISALILFNIYIAMVLKYGIKLNLVFIF